MSNDPRENMHGSDSLELADVTADAARAASTPVHTSDEVPTQRSALSSFEEILSGATHDADAPTADDGAQERGFAAAVGANKREGLTPIHVEGQAGQRRGIPIPQRRFLKRNEVRHH